MGPGKHSTASSPLAWVISTLASSRKAVEDVIISAAPQAFKAFSGIIISVLMARGLGADGMGEYALVMSVSSFILGLSDLGIGQTAIRFASRAAGQGNVKLQLAVLCWSFHRRMFAVLLLCVAGFFITPLVVEKLWHVDHLTPLVRLSLLIAVFGAIAAVPIIYFQSIKRFKMSALVGIGQTLLLLVGVSLLAYLGNWSVNGVIVVTILASAFSSAISVFLVPRSIFFNPMEGRGGAAGKGKLKNFWLVPGTASSGSENPGVFDGQSFAFFMMLSSVTVLLTMRADVWLMGLFLDTNQIGIYSVATRLTLPLVMLLGALNTALWPRASSLICREEIKKLLRKTFGISVAIAVCAVAYSIVAPLFIPWVFGSAYEGGILLAQLLCLRYCISILVCPVGVIGYSFGMVSVYWWINLCQLIVVVGINILLLPKVGVLGAAIALILNEVIGLSLILNNIREKLKTIS
ncbi:oligosaccharide flippase family protein [Desulfuromonas versatilis]|uniref:oligosaccharide flippase family protein n=1 Tax=Desulfuromonas versatilis TaxID=2802975 RepID=UPI001C862CDC|nr:oligosaccharide flippase family protein [Desulfuromonas versatilis]